MGLWQRILGLAAAALLIGAAPAQPVARYLVNGHFDLDRGTIANSVTIQLPGGAPLNETFVFSRRFTIEDARVKGPAKLTIGTTDRPLKNLHSLRVTGSGKGPVQLIVRYRGPIDDGSEAGKRPPRQLVELAADWMWLPVQDHIALPFTVKARFDGLPLTMVVASQGRIGRGRNSLTIDRSLPDVDLPFVAAEGMKRVSDSHDVELFARYPEDRIVQLFRKHAVGSIRYFENLLGPMTTRPLRIVVVPRDTSSAYARAAYIVIAEAGTHGVALPEKFPERNPAKYVAHEGGHIWWMGADAQSEDNWLNESFAEYCAMRYIEATFGVDERKAAMARFGERAAGSGAILGHGRPKADAVYARGPLLLFELEAVIGRARMDRYMRTVANLPRKTTAAALEHLATIAGRDVARTFEDKLRAAEYKPAG